MFRAAKRGAFDFSCPLRFLHPDVFDEDRTPGGPWLSVVKAPPSGGFGFSPLIKRVIPSAPQRERDLQFAFRWEPPSLLGGSGHSAR
jgi:hypothetical protein